METKPHSATIHHKSNFFMLNCWALRITKGRLLGSLVVVEIQRVDSFFHDDVDANPH